MSNMYPDLNDEDDKNQLAGASQVTYQSTTTTTTQDKKKKKGQEKDNCCVAGAKFWISVIGALNLVRIYICIYIMYLYVYTYA